MWYLGVAAVTPFFLVSTLKNKPPAMSHGDGSASQGDGSVAQNEPENRPLGWFEKVRECNRKIVEKTQEM